MASTFLGLNTGLSGLNYYQATLNTTAHNISNADREGYSRQTVLSEAAQALRIRTCYGMMGTGVQATGIDQLRNVYYDTKFRASNSKLNEYTALNEQLSQLQSYMNEMKTESGYTELFAKVTAAMQDLAGSPSDATYRTQFIQAFNNFTDLINEVATNYQKQQVDINNEIAIHVDSINSISSQIFTLNKQIMNIETRYGNANDLRDQRELLVDELSKLVNVTVVESPLLYREGNNEVDSGTTRYEVRIGNALLVDDMESRQLAVSARQEKINQNDADGLYDVYWVGLNNALGEEFNFNSGNVTGLMKGLLEVRDGNNANPFAGTIKMLNTGTVDGSTVTIELDDAIAIDKLNLPKEGTITLNCKDYYYEGFEAVYNAKGDLKTFVFKNLTIEDETGKRIPAEFNQAIDLGKPASMGESIDCKGIPYYMTELNEFVRTLSTYMNNIYTKGADANGDPGLDFFTAADIKGNDYVLTPNLNTAGMTSTESNYYQLTALNWSINRTIAMDQNKLVVSMKEDIEQGNKDAKSVLEDMIYGMTDQNMFSQGTVSQFLQAVTTSQAVDISKFESFFKNMDEVTTVINNQRLSVSSVDTNEEAAALVMYQNGFNLSSKVISVMNEVYDKLINQTG